MTSAGVPLLVITALAFIVAGSQATPLRAAEALKQAFNFSDVVASGKFSTRGFNGTWISGTEFVYRNAQSNIIRYDASTDTHSTFFNADILNAWTTPTWSLSPDNAKLLIRHNVTPIFRHSIVASYAIYDIETKKVTDIADKALLSVCVWSPNAQHIVYVHDNDAYLFRELRTIERLSSDGIPGIIYNGVPDWVYEEEVFGSGGAVWLAPGGSRLVMASFDDRQVPEFTYQLYSEQYETDVKLRYPKVGSRNPVVTLRHIDLNAPEAGWRSLPAPVERVSGDHILRSVAWLDVSTFGVFWMNRRQNRTVFQQCDAPSNTCRIDFEINEPDGWVDLGSMRCAPSGRRCFFIDYVGNWLNIYEYDVTSGSHKPFVVDAFTVVSIYGYDESKDEIFYLATTTERAYERHVFRNRECLTCAVRDVDGAACTYASASFSRDLSHYALTCSGPNVPYTTLFRAADNAELFVWVSNENVRRLLDGYALPRVQFVQVPLPGGIGYAAVKLYLPAGLETSGNRTYPMVVDVYGGPNSVRVTDAFSLGYKAFLITSRQVIYAQIDGRGSGYKGKAMLFAVNNRLGTVEIEDQIEVTRHLQHELAFVDARRTAIWGWSYGGYATARVLAADHDQVFRCGISVAPVSSWFYYDTIYTERYMGLPVQADNLRGYVNGDISLNLTENAFGQHKFMLVHGNADDNVHYQNALVFTNALVEANIDFEQVSYPNEAHGLNGVQPHLYHTIDRFWVDCLDL